MRVEAEINQAVKALEHETEALEREAFRRRLRGSLELETIMLRHETARLRSVLR